MGVSGGRGRSRLLRRGGGRSEPRDFHDAPAVDDGEQRTHQHRHDRRPVRSFDQGFEQNPFADKARGPRHANQAQGTDDKGGKQ